MCEQMTLYYVYVLRSVEEPHRHYTGYSRDPGKRLEAHNLGKSNHTAKYRPWILETVIGFSDEQKAKEFERYLKSHSGRAFSSKHF